MPAKSSESAAPPGTGLQLHALIALNFAACFFCGGIVWGWGSLQLLLEEDGVYRSMCPAEAPHCTDRKDALLLLFNMGVVIGTYALLPLGILVDKAGPRASGTIAGILLATGFALLGYSEDGGLEAFRTGIVLIVIGGHLVQTNSFPLSHVVPEACVPFVMTGINCFYDASITVTWFLHQLYRSAGLSRKSIFVGYSVFCLTAHAVMVTVWSGDPVTRLCAAKAGLEHSGFDAGSERAAPPLHRLPLRDQLTTFEFAFALMFSCVQVFRCTFYLGSNKELLETLGDAETNHFYVGLSSLLLPSAIVCIPAISWLMRRCGYAGTFLATIIVGAIWNIVALVPSLPLQVVAFVSFSLFRALLFSGTFAFIAQIFGPRTCATVQGVIFVLNACVCLFVWPCMVFVGRHLGGDLSPIFATSLALLVPLVAMLPRLQNKLEDAPAADCYDSTCQQGHDLPL